MNDRKGHRKLRLTSRKHFKPKPKLPKSLKISISMQHVSVLKVSVPIDLVNFHVSIPLSMFLDSPVPTVCVLHRRLQSLGKIPQGIAKCCFNELIYFYTLSLGWSTSIQNGMLVVVEVSCLEKSPGPILLKTIKVNSDFTWTVTYRGHLVSNKCEVLQRFPSLINTGKFVA